MPPSMRPSAPTADRTDNAAVSRKQLHRFDQGVRRRAPFLSASCGSCPLAAKAAGFTLIELVTAIVIVGILSAATLPRMFDNNSFSERGYVDEIAATLRYSQKIAIASGCEVAVTLNADNYVASQRAAAGNNCDPTGAWTTPLMRAEGQAVAGTAPANIVMGPATTIVFEGDGSLSAAAPAITVGKFTLGVNAASGVVTVVP